MSVNAPVRPSTASLPTNAFLKTGQFLLADDNSHYAVMGGDGRFSVCKGTGPDDPAARLIVQVPTDPQQQGNFFIIMQADGNLCIYKGTGRGDNQGFVWGLNCVRRDMPRPPGEGYVATLSSMGDFSCFDRNPGHDPREGPYWTLTPHHQEEEEFLVVVVQAVRPLDAAPDRRPSIRHRIQPHFTSQLTKLELAIGSPAGRTCDVRVNVYRGGLDSTDLMISENFTAQHLTYDELMARKRQTYEFKSPALMVEREIYTIELSTANRGEGLSVGLNTAQPGPGPNYDDHLCFTAWTLRP
jgi:hypothetical protein